jgi:hypothetical protein
VKVGLQLLGLFDLKGTTVSDTRSVGSVSQLGVFESKGHTFDGGNLSLGNVRR